MTDPIEPISDEALKEMEADAIGRINLMEGHCEGGKWLSKDYSCRHCGAGPKDNCRMPLPKRYDSSTSILALIARLRAAEVEARRYRWLRDLPDGSPHEEIGNMPSDCWDTAIDDAMEPKP